MGPSCCGGDGEVATTRAKLSADASAGAGSEDRLSALPDDILVLILGHLSTRAVARTSVLSRRWRLVWALLPELHFLFSLEPHQIGPAIQAHEAAIRCLFVGTRDAGPESVAAWLPVAARRLSGFLFFQNLEPEGSAQEGHDDGEEAGQRGAFELPCVERATKVSLHLGFFGLAVPPAGVFARLTGLCLDRVRLYGPGDHGDAVSWPRSPCLQKLTVRDARGPDNLAIHSVSLRQVELTGLHGFRQLNIVTPALEESKVTHCFFYIRSHMIQAPSILAR
jgi:hypothetical protein